MSYTLQRGTARGFAYTGHFAAARSHGQIGPSSASNGASGDLAYVGDRLVETGTRFRKLQPSVITSAHSPLVSGGAIDAAFGHLATLPDVTPPPHPDQAALEAALSGAAA